MTLDSLQLETIFNKGLIASNISVIFVHGLKGHPERTWGHRRHETPEAEDTSSHKQRKSTRSFLGFDKFSSKTVKSRGKPAPVRRFWPEEFLAQDLPEARVWTYGYNCHVIEDTFKPNNKNNISQHARDLAVKFDQSINNEDPVVFIAHSLGGIIVKDKRTKLIVFLGTPHRGSAQAAWGMVATNIARLALLDSNKGLVAGLLVNNEVLDNIQEQFINLLHDSDIKVHSFQEGRGVSGVSGFNGKIVFDDSSKLGLPKAIETVQTIDADHRQMTKFLSKDDAGYRDIVAVLKEFVQSINLRDAAIHPVTVRIGPDPQSNISHMPSYVPSNGPPFFHIPLPANDRFVGRQSVLQKLDAMLFEGTEHRKVAIVGLGGIGKTQVALHLALAVKSKKPGYSVFWVSALSTATFEQGYTSIMKACGFGRDGVEDPKTRVKEFLESTAAGDWLLIVDNVDVEEVLWGLNGDGNTLFDFLPQSDKGRIVFTTRFRKLALAAASRSIIDLSDISPEEARAYFENSLVDKALLDDDKAVTDLLKLLTGLPLAITQAAAYLNENQISVAEYLELFNNTEQDKIELLKSEFKDDTRYHQAQNAIANTLVLSFSQLRKVDVFAEKLLLFISYIEPKAIPLSLLPETESRQQLIHAVGTLCGYGFLTRRQDQKMFDMHSLVHVASRAWLLDIGAGKDERGEAITWMRNVFPRPQWDTRELWRQYLPHAVKVLDLRSYSAAACKLGLRVAIALREERRMTEALSLLDQVVQIESKALPEDNPDRLRSQVKVMKIIIVGAGLGGLSAAFCFARRNHEVIVLDQYDHLSPRGGSLSTRPGASRVLRSWGLEPDLELMANKTSQVMLRNLETGEILGQTMTAGDESNFIHWGTTRLELIDLFYRKGCEAGATIRFGVSVQDVREEATLAHAVLRDGSSIQGDLILVADGIRSRLRSKVLGDSVDPIEPILSDTTSYGFSLSTADLTAHPERTARLTETLCTNIWISPEVFAVTRYNKKGGYVHFLYNTKQNNPDQRGLWDENGDVTHIQKAFSHSCSEISTAVQMAPSCDRWRLAELPPLPSHISEGGRLVLVGDSAHAMHPSVGQGFSQIVEDIAVLDELISRSPKPDAEVPQITQHWQAIRKPRVERIQEYSQWNTKNVSKGPRVPSGQQPAAKSFQDVVPDMHADFSTQEFMKWTLDYDPTKEVDTHFAQQETLKM
ncbi:putative Kinesin light chain [Paramyrothecium foliicola]|nr:putative Kinesin light chain [Paramyrothecium foliicola]